MYEYHMYLNAVLIFSYDLLLVSKWCYSCVSAGLKFKEVAKTTVWHPEVKQFAVTDAETGERMGYFYLDLHPR